MPVSLDDHLRNIPPATRPAVEAAVAVVRSLGEGAEEAVYQSRRPANPSAMWKLVRFRSRGEDVVGIGTFTEHANLFFYRGTELPDPDGLLRGGGREMRSVTLRSADDARSGEVRSLVREAFNLAGRSGSRSREK